MAAAAAGKWRQAEQNVCSAVDQPWCIIRHMACHTTLQCDCTDAGVPQEQYNMSHDMTYVGVTLIWCIPGPVRHCAAVLVAL